MAMALAQRTDIIFLDEPTTYLDISHQLEILELITRLNQEQGCTIIMVLHDINQGQHTFCVAICNNISIFHCN